jgi:excisionase family DNA binding protein
MRIAPEYLTLEALSDYAQVSVSTLRRWLKADMPHYRLGRGIRVKRIEFDIWLKQFQAVPGTEIHPLDAAWQEVMEEVSS